MHGGMWLSPGIREKSNTCANEAQAHQWLFPDRWDLVVDTLFLDDGESHQFSVGKGLPQPGPIVISS